MSVCSKGKAQVAPLKLIIFKCLRCPNTYFKSKDRQKLHYLEFHNSEVHYDFKVKTTQKLSCQTFEFYEQSPIEGSKIRAPTDRSNSHKCPKCNMMFGRAYHLKRHLSKVRCEKLKKFECHHCKIRFDYKSNLRRHLRNIHFYY